MDQHACSRHNHFHQVNNITKNPGTTTLKKTLALIAAFTAGFAQALSFSWGTGTVAAQFDGTAIGSAKGYLVYLGDTGSAWSITGVDGGTAVQEKAATTAPPVLAGRITETFKKSYGSAFDDGGTFANGATFAMFITYNDGKNDWYNFSANTYTVSGAMDDTSTLQAATFTFDFSTKTEIKSTQNASGGGGWYAAVPEPSVALMGLLGLGMLLKRRRA